MRSLTLYRWCLFLLALLTLRLPACSRKEKGPPLYPVRGQVFVQGKPAVKADVFFHPLVNRDPRAPHPHARVNASGAFQAGTRRANDGAPAGEYAVTIVWTPAEDVEDPPDLLGGRYRDPETSPLRVQVQEKTNELPPFNLE